MFSTGFVEGTSGTTGDDEGPEEVVTSRVVSYFSKTEHKTPPVILHRDQDSAR